MGHGADAGTTNISWMVGHYLGDAANPCITVIDTPGTGDTEGRDCEHGIALTEEIKQMGSIDAFVFLYKGISPRFTQSMEDQIKLYMSIFGQEIWQNTITEFTFWRHDKRSIRERAHIRGSLSLSTTDGTRITEKDLKSYSQYHQFSLIQCMMKNMQTTKKKRSMRKILTSSGICSPSQ